MNILLPIGHCSAARTKHHCFSTSSGPETFVFFSLLFHHSRYLLLLRISDISRSQADEPQQSKKHVRAFRIREPSLSVIKCRIIACNSFWQIRMSVQARFLVGLASNLFMRFLRALNRQCSEEMNCRSYTMARKSSAVLARSFRERRLQLI